MRGDCWPTALQTLLLRAALFDDDRGRRAIEAWRSQVDLDRLDPGSARLLPLVLPRLSDGPLAAIAARARQARDDAARRNGPLIDMTAAVIRTLGDAGIDSLLLKGMALVARGYVAPGERPMADADLLVRERQALAARDVLSAAGWRLEGRLDAEYLSLRHGASVRSPSGYQLDLHWHVLADCCEPGADDDFWRAAEPARLRDAPVLTLSPADMVLHACVHGVRWSTVPPVRWAADALTVIRAADPPVEWERIADQAERRVLVLPVRDTLRYLRDNLDAPVPGDLLARLDRARAPRWARAEYLVKRRRRSPARQALFHWFQHRRLNRSRTLVGAAFRFPLYLRRRFRAAGLSSEAYAPAAVRRSPP